jgi:hypothetical protein
MISGEMECLVDHQGYAGLRIATFFSGNDSLSTTFRFSPLIKIFQADFQALKTHNRR